MCPLSGAASLAVLAIGNSAGIESSPADGAMPAALRRLAGLLDACPIELAQYPEDLRAIAWIRQSLEDLEATIPGLARSNLPQFPDDRQHRARLPAAWFPAVPDLPA